MTGIVLTALFFGLMLLGVPIAFVIGIVSYVGFFLLDAIPLQSVVQQMFSGLESFILLAVPLFIFAANIMNQGKISEKLVQFAVALVGHIRGGLAHANIVVSMFFGGISGASTADTAGIGKIMIPSMAKEKYHKETAAAVTAASSTMGMIIPPSIPMVIYGSLAGVSVGKMFIGGIIPGLAIAGGLMALIGIISHRHQYPKYERVKVKEVLLRGLKSIPPLLTPVIILGGITGGVVTPTEAAVLACAYAFVLSFFIYRTISLKDLPGIVYDTLKLSSLTLFALATATSLGRLISYYNVPSAVESFFANALPFDWMFVLAVIVLFLLVGMFMDTVPSIVLFVPIVLPTATQIGIDPVHFGLIVMMCLAVGLVTPPYGLCLLLASKIAEIPIGRSFYATIPYIAVILLVIGVIAFIPETAMWLPNSFDF
ncbi:TRAP transporter large permease [Salibacterium qingdaonense]|uniref:TRAP transporter, DctM subunit n=1 Tax=Salibacterium qingdaonense TaxID=266892 RepID=A0A1I4LDL5_9BACI|nr:TRAP transporter large permease [Salibacterium qingdaonense]SFL89021.1 TRAP transporter, DctM subunit [Salibacterium qingdaonense]